MEVQQEENKLENMELVADLREDYPYFGRFKEPQSPRENAEEHFPFRHIQDYASKWPQSYLN